MSIALIGNVRERWAELGNEDPERVAERYRGDPWRLFYNGWIEGRAELISARAKDAELIQQLVDALHDSQPNHHEDAHSRYNDAMDAATAAGFKPSEQ